MNAAIRGLALAGGAVGPGGSRGGLHTMYDNFDARADILSRCNGEKAAEIAPEGVLNFDQKLK